MEPLYQGALDVFLVKVRADFDAVTDQAMLSTRSLEDWSLVSTDSKVMSLFTQVGAKTSEGDRAVWRHVGTTGIQNVGTRTAGSLYPEANFLRTWETAVFDPNTQLAAQIVVPEERELKEASVYKEFLNRAQKEVYEINRRNIADLFEVFNLAFTLPTSYPTRFFAKGNQGLDGNYTALNERLISTQHARADAGTTISNAVNVSGLAATFTDTNYWSAREMGATIVDDVGKPMPVFGSRCTIVLPPANGLVRTALEIDKSEWKVGTANNEVNVQQGLLNTIKSSPYLLQSFYLSTVSNKTQWFLVDEYLRDPEVGTNLVKIEFVPFQSRVERLEPNDAIVYKAKEEYVYGWTDFRCIIGSNGSGVAYSS